MNLQEFITTLFGKVERGYINVWTLQNKLSKSFKVTEINKIASYALGAKDKDIYFGVGVRNVDFNGESRGKNTDISAITCLWHDIDIKGVAHKQAKLPETKEQAIEYLESLEQQPSIIVSSGNGLHAYWVLDKPLYIMTEEHRANVSAMLTGFQRELNGKAKEKGWILDNTSDLARVLRVPSTINQKLQNGAMCEILSVADKVYKAEDFYRFMKEKDKEVKTQENTERTAFTGEVGKADRCISECRFIEYCKENAEKLPEPYWHAMVSNISLADDGVKACHELSSKYPSYDKKETENKAERARRERKPHTCKYIQQSLGFDCNGCNAKCKAPIGLAVISKLDKARTVLEKEFTEIKQLYSDEVLEALAYLKEESIKDYSLFKLNTKEKFKKLNLVEYDKAIAKVAIEKKTAKTACGDVLTFEGIDLGGAVAPANYSVTEQGVKKIVQSGDTVKVIDVCHQPLVLECRLINVDKDTEKVKLAFKADGEWKSIVGDRAEMFNKNSILKYSNDKLKVSTNNASEIVEYLEKYEAVNNDKIKRSKSINRFGWFGNKVFFPYVKNGIEYETDSQTAEMFKHAKTNGSYDEWKKMIEKVRENNFARLILAASFASPLLEKISCRNFVMHVWAGSKSGKSAVLKAAMSVWGDPNRMISSFYSTKVGIELMATTLRNLPLAIDEKQVNDDKKVSLESTVYVLGQGQGKVRGTKSGGTAEIGYWNNISITNGEEPLLDSKTKNGATTRSIEFYGTPTENEELGKWVHKMTSRHYGHASTVYMEYICQQLQNNSNSLIEVYDRFCDDFASRGHKSVHADYCCNLALGDYYSSIAIFGQDENTAYIEALNMALKGLENSREHMQAEVVLRAWDFVQGWLVSNVHRFESDSTPIYGKIEKGAYIVIPEYVDNAMIEAGFTPQAMIAGFKERGFIKSFKTPSYTGCKKKETIAGNRIMCYHMIVETEKSEVTPL